MWVSQNFLLYMLYTSQNSIANSNNFLLMANKFIHTYIHTLKTNAPFHYSKLTLKTTAPFHYSPAYQKLLKGLFMTKHKSFSHKILYRFQSGFRKNYSTNTCLGHLTGKITTGFEKGLFTGMILIDLQTAFDTIDHQISIKKMKYLGFSKKVVAWFKSYISE